jgi:alpha-beta hydrolase superfamily lysophospholipase
MISETNTFKGAGNKDIHYYKWSADNPKAILQVIHGMGEHAGRYNRLAEDLTKEGFVLYANDHRGHGHTAETVDKIGYFEDRHFWNDTQSDLKQLTSIAKAEHPDLPIIALGHSMGSFLLRDYLTTMDQPFVAAIISGTGGDPGALGKVGKFIAKLLGAVYGRATRSEFLRSISFGKFNKEFAPMRTKADWITRDVDVVDEYVADEMCSKTFTNGFWDNMLEGVLKINKKTAFEQTPKDLPIYMFAGERDPVGDFGKGVTEVFNNYKNAGVKHIECTLYPEARHEMLNETNRDEVIASMLSWMNEVLAVKH